MPNTIQGKTITCHGCSKNLFHELKFNKTHSFRMFTNKWEKGKKDGSDILIQCLECNCIFEYK